jgi:hypothetical protein
MKPKLFSLLALVALFGATLILNSCGASQAGCPVCGTDKNGTIGLIDVMYVPEHNPNGEPGGPFNIFDISWVDPVNRLYYVSDRIGLDVPMFSTTSDIALWAIGGDNSVAEAGNNASTCIDSAKFPADLTIIPPITTAQGNYTRFGCKTLNFTLPGFFGPNGHFGGFVGGQCCASRANNLNPLSGPNGLEISADGNFAFVGNGSSSVLVFDLTATIANPGTPPRVTAVLVSGTSPDYDGPNGVSPCMASADGRAFSDPTCGDLRGDELATTGATPAIDPLGNPHDLLMVINGDPGLPFVTIFDITNVIGHGTGTPTQQQLHCLPVNPNAPFSPGGSHTTFPQNLSSCVLGQIYYDGSPANNIDTVIDDGGANAGIPCPNPSLQFADFTSVPSGASGHGVGVGGADVPCHRAGFIPAFGATEIAPAGLGGMVYIPQTGHFLLTNGNASGDITLGTVDEIDPFHPITPTGPFVPAVINSFPIFSCMPTGLNLGPGTDVMVGCADHDGRAFSPNAVIINGTTGQVLTTITNVGFVDETWYNPGDNNYYLGARDMPGGPVLGVINAGTRQWLQNVPTNGNAHSVAADPKNNHIFVPLPSGGQNCETINADGCVGVYASQ